jgi:dihydrofolate reductase
MQRPTVSVYIAVSPDGFIAHVDGGLDWLEPMQVPGEDYGYGQFFSGIDAVVMGRATYDTALGFGAWPFANKRVAVLTHRPLDSKHGETSHNGPLPPLLAALAAEGVRHVYLDGGQVIREGLSERLVDDITLSTVPIVLGRGRPLFDESLPESNWALVSSRSFATGLVQSRYRSTHAIHVV